ncbi:MAG: DUF4382 domain-containing protein [Algoriphagus sp.]|uniref:DUF4382 domain-containing protein n=1 Tax=Algoriphagus sp. TaxID=1872435 RepID=UPI0017EA5B4C|nr:DUF4382 domain-containing protein [Algoriphagus sp.]NVJ86458.1 DUF4382 domain-containing protein [Algoriphagus sp.]
MRKIHALFIFSILSLSFLGCSSGDESPKALLNLVLVDAPPAYDSVFVEILGVDVLMNVEGRDTEQQSFFIPYELGDKRIKISDLVAGEVLLLGRGTLPPGQIIGMEMRLGSSHSLWENEKSYPLPLKSDLDPLIPIDAELSLDAGLSYDLILDFDLEKSIRTISLEPFSFELDPKIETIYPGQFGELKGSISQTTLRPAIFAIRNGDSTSTHTNSSGSFLFRLPEGIYDIYLDPKDDAFLADTLFGVEIINRKSITLDRISFRPKP